MAERILLVEDEQALRMTLRDRLENEEYEVQCASNGQEGLAMALEGHFDLVILDVMLPKKKGFDVCREIRSAGLTVPILMLTARGETIDKVLGLKLGADDYLTKPFEMMELVARVEALLRRSPQPVVPGDGYRVFGPIEVDLRGTSVSRNGRKVLLSAREFQLLRYLLEHEGATISRDVLLKEVWGYNSTAFTRTVDVHIASLRQKLEKDPKRPALILTVPGLGYKFAP